MYEFLIIPNVDMLLYEGQRVETRQDALDALRVLALPSYDYLDVSVPPVFWQIALKRRHMAKAR